MQTIKCPYCGAPLPGGAVFCPHCARSLNRRVRARRLRAFPRRALCLLPAAALAALVLLAGFSARPRVYQGGEELLYTDAGGTYRLQLSWAGADGEGPAGAIRQTAAAGQPGSVQLQLQVSLAETGADANAAFRRNIRWARLEAEAPAGDAGTLTWEEPAPASGGGRAALACAVDYTARTDFTTRLYWTIQLDNGDQIQMYQDLAVEAAPSCHIYPKDADMRTIGALQDLVDRLDQLAEAKAAVTLHLPPVTYAGELVIRSRAVTLSGSAQGEGRTTFTGPVRIQLPAESGTCRLRGIDFQGDGDGTAVSAAAPVRAEDCSFTGWETGLLGRGEGWVSASGCTFSQNGVGLRLDSRAGKAGYTLNDGNEFLNNGVAVQLEQAPGDASLDFRDSLFAGNGTDIENLCSQPLEIGRAVFQ